MPYDNVSEAVKKHPNLDKYSAKAKSAWVKAFNNAWESKNDESYAFAVAYSAANNVDGKKRKAAIIEDADASMNILGATALFIAKDATYEDYAYIFFDNGGNLGTHMNDFETTESVLLNLPSIFNGELSTRSWYIAPAKIENIVTFYTWTLENLLNYIQGSKNVPSKQIINDKMEEYWLILKQFNQLIDSMGGDV